MMKMIFLVGKFLALLQACNVIYNKEVKTLMIHNT